LTVDKWQNLQLERQGRLAVVTLNRPEKTNALSPEMMLEIRDAFWEIAADDGVGAVLLTGAGKSFSAGGDLKMDIEVLGKMTAKEFDDFFQSVDDMLMSIINLEKPVVAAVNGYAIAGGMELALASDIRIAAADAQFGALFVRMGLAPELGLYLLPRLVGLGMAKMIALTGDFVAADEALRLGLVERVVPPGELLENATKLAARLARGPRATGLIKRALNDSTGMDLRATMTYSRRLTYELAHTEDHQEAVAAFLENRKPDFKGR
jgi:enoyl-CoA hydratase/carnithine racemase